MSSSRRASREVKKQKRNQQVLANALAARLNDEPVGNIPWRSPVVEKRALASQGMQRFAL
jgi:hypothetical protein